MKESCLKGCFCSKEIKDCHPESRPLPLGRSLKGFYSGANKTVSGSTPLVTIQNKEEMLKRVQHNNRRRAFTLIELLVVVLIIGILAAVAVPQYKRAVTKSQYINLEMTARSLNNSIQRFFLENGKYPSRFSALDIDLAGGTDDPTRYTLSDGSYCDLRVSNKELYCSISGGGMAILISYATQRIACRAYNSYRAQLCKSFSGSTLSCNPAEQSGGYCDYVYVK